MCACTSGPSIDWTEIVRRALIVIGEQTLIRGAMKWIDAR